MFKNQWVKLIQLEPFDLKVVGRVRAATRRLEGVNMADCLAANPPYEF